MLDTIRHQEVFTSSELHDLHIDVIGVGATGSRIALSLAKLGIQNIDIWDPDKVEAHNIPNQAFGNYDIGKPKVHALRELIMAQTGIKVGTHKKRVDGSQRLGPIVFLLTDSMASRREIFERALRFKSHVKIVIETRMGADEGRVYTFSPFVPRDVREWEEAWYPDEETDPSVCTISTTVGPTAEIISGYAVWQFIRWHKAQTLLVQGKTPNDVPESELIFSLRPHMHMQRTFSDD